MTKEVPRKVFVVVLIIAIIISSYLTLMSLRNMDSFGDEQREGNTVQIQSAAVMLNVIAPESIEGNPSTEGGVNSND
jgi:hypothetical protein